MQRRLVLAALAARQGALAQPGSPVVVFGDDNYAPVIHRAGGKARGFLVDLLQRVEASGLAQFELRLVPWNRAYVSATRGEGGLIGVSRTAEREQLFDYSKPIYHDDIRLVMLRGREFEFRGLQDLAGKRIGGVIGASYGDAVDRAIRAGVFRMDRDIGVSNRLRKLLAGRLDAAFVGNGSCGVALALSSEPELVAERARFLLHPQTVNRDPLHLAFAKTLDKKAFVAAFDATVERLGMATFDLRCGIDAPL